MKESFGLYLGFRICEFKNIISHYEKTFNELSLLDLNEGTNEFISTHQT